MKLLTIISLLIFSSFIHPLYISSIDIKHNAKEKNIEISIRAFSDDVEATLKNMYKKNIELSVATNKDEANKLLASYVQNKLQLSLNTRQQTIHLLGYEIQKESVWIYAEINNVTSVQSININCNWLYELSNKQSNIFSVIAKDDEKNFKLDYPKTSFELSF